MDWLRLWHDMPNDPKWRTIARASKQPVSVVIAVYLHVLVNASSNATERGRTHSIVSEDIASAIDVQTEDVDAILAAMQGRVLDGEHVSGWSKRQPAREDGSAERSRAWREAKKAKNERGANAAERIANATERNRSKTNAPDTDTDTDKSKSSLRHRGDDGTVADAFESRFWPAYPRKVGKADAAKAFAKLKPDDALLAVMLGALATQRDSDDWRRDGGQFVPHPATWINGKRWQDEVPAARRAPVANAMSDILARAV